MRYRRRRRRHVPNFRRERDRTGQRAISARRISSSHRAPARPPSSLLARDIITCVYIYIYFHKNQTIYCPVGARRRRRLIASGTTRRPCIYYYYIQDNNVIIYYNIYAAHRMEIETIFLNFCFLLLVFIRPLQRKNDRYDAPLFLLLFGVHI